MVTRRLYRMLLWTLLTLAPGLAHAGLFVLIDGVPGASRDTGHLQWIDARNVSWNVGPAAPKTATTSPPASLVVDEGSWSARLALYAVTATRVNQVVIEETALIAQGPVVISRVTLNNVSIRSLKSSTSPPQYGVNQIELGYGRITWENWLYDPSGRLVSALKTGFDYDRGAVF